MPAASSPPPAPAPLPPPAAGSRSWLGRWRHYRHGALGEDVLAALIVTILLVPQSLAYAMLAGLPPVVGVMASTLPIVAYALFGSSSTLAVGPVAVISMMTAQAIGSLDASLGVSPHVAALVLALEMGVLFLLAAWLRLETLAALLSAPVLHGFITGASVLIALGQIPTLLGLQAQGSTALELLPSWWHSAQPWPHTHTAVIGGLALLVLWLLRRWGSTVLLRLGLAPRTAQLSARAAPILVVMAGIAWMAWAPQYGHGVALTGSLNLRHGLSFPMPWQAPQAVWLTMLTPAALLALVAYVESLAVAEALGKKRGERVSPRRELYGLAAANMATSVSGGMPVTGGFARSIVNFDAGAQTRMAGVWTALFLIIAMASLGGVLQYLPRAVLAATIILAVLSLLESGPYRLAWQHSRTEFFLMVGVTVLTLFAGVQTALLVGVVLAIGLLLQRTSRPHWTEVGRLPNSDVFRNVRRFAVTTQPHVLSIRVDESLVFTNSRWISDALFARIAERPDLQHVVLMMSGVNGIDLTGLEVLQQLNASLQARGLKLHLSEIKGPVRGRLESSKLGSWLSGQVFMTQAEADNTLRRTAPTA